eukprot:9357643-Ditylum_brightwellii.AAC.1
MYEELKSFQQKNKHTIVPETVTMKQLVYWVDEHRREYRAYMDTTGCRIRKRKRVQLTEERIPLKRSEWNIHFQLLMEYKETCGDCNVPVPYKIKPELGKFVRTQRVLYKLRKEGIHTWLMLSDEQVDHLDEIGFSWLETGGVQEEDIDRDL